MRIENKLRSPAGDDTPVRHVLHFASGVCPRPTHILGPTRRKMSDMTEAKSFQALALRRCLSRSPFASTELHLMEGCVRQTLS